MKNAALRGKPDAGNPHVRFDEGEVAPAKPRRGSLLYKKCLSVGVLALSLSVQASPLRIGAINWDCSLPASTFFGGYATRSLGPRQFRDRTPYYAQAVGADRIEYRYRTVAEYEVEMRYAIAAGIDYFAYCWYDGIPSTNHVSTGSSTAADPHRHELVNGRHLHLQSGLRDQLGFCAILVTCGYYSDESIDELVAAMKLPGYERVDGRPLVYIFSAPWEGVLARLRRRCKDVGVASPYVVRMLSRAAGVKAPEDVDAYCAYACSERAEEWDTFQAAVRDGNAARMKFGKPVLPHWSVGWDPRPRILHKVPWCGYPDHQYHSPATQSQLVEGVRKLIEWMTANSGACVPGQLLVFAWNEFEEGGWICPTLGADGKPDTLRSDAFIAATKVLRGVKNP